MNDTAASHKFRRHGTPGDYPRRSFDDHFAVYRYGRKRDRAFEVLR